MNELTAKTRDSDATRLALLRAATPLFALHGFDGCRNQQIADAAGTNKAMINYHFGGKLGLYRSVVTEAVMATKPLIDEFRKTASILSTTDRLGVWIHTLDDSFSDQPHLPALLLREHMEGGRRLQQEFRKHISQFYKTTHWVLTDDAGDLVPRSADHTHMVHLSLIGALTFFLVSQPYRDQAARKGTSVVEAPDRKNYIDYLVRLYQHGLTEPKTT